LPPEKGQPEPPTERSRSGSFPAPGCLAAFLFSCPRRAHCPLSTTHGENRFRQGTGKKAPLATAHFEAATWQPEATLSWWARMLADQLHLSWTRG
jgi:hypothetical protein